MKLLFTVSLNLPRPGSPLSIEVHGGYSETHNSGEEGLLHVGVLLEGHVLDDGGQLVVVPNHNPALESAEAVRGVLQQQRNEGLDLQDLG